MTQILFTTEDYEDDVDNYVFQDDWHEFRQSLIEATNNRLCILQGTEGLWNGKHKAGAIDLLENLFTKALDNKDGFEFQNRDGQLWLTTYHHDGRNEYHVKVLTNGGLEIYDHYQYDMNSEYYVMSKEKIHDLIMEHYSEELIGGEEGK